MIYFVEDLPLEWRPKWDEMRLKSGREHSLCKSNIEALLAIFITPRRI